MTASCNVPGQSILRLGGVTASILFFFYCGKFVPSVFEGPAGKKILFFHKKCTMLDLGALVGFFFNVSLKTVSQIRWFVKTKDLTQQREIELCLKQTAPALSLCSWMCKTRNLLTWKAHFSANTPWQFCRLQVPCSVGVSKENSVEPWTMKFKCKNILVINGESAHVSRYQSD